MFERIAIDLFFERAVQRHLLTRTCGFVVICALLLGTGLISWILALAWAVALVFAELDIRHWYRTTFLRKTTAADQKKVMWQFIRRSATLAVVYSGPSLLIFNHGTIGAAVGLALCTCVFLVICVQHNITKSAFFISGFVPGLGLVLSMAFLVDGVARFYLVALAIALLVNARSLHHANADTFKSLVDSRSEAERFAAQLNEALLAAEAGSRSKSTFLATMSHELRTPLNGVIGMADALAASEFDPGRLQAVDVIRKSGKALLTILNDVLDLSMIEAGRLDIQAAEFDLGAALNDVCLLFASVAEDKGLKLSFERAGESMGGSGSPGGWCVGDVARLRQVVSNLISNAIKFTDQGSVQVRLHRLDACSVQIEIADTGVGLSPAASSRLFERFSQVDGSSTRRFGGAGLGLAISRELCQLMGGDIHVESQYGGGSVFTVVLPLPAVAPAANAPQPMEEEPVVGVRVLCAEDNPTNQLVLRTLLGHLGCNPTLVANGALAVEAWERGAWDLVLMDVQMPVMDGLSAIRAIRAAEAANNLGRTPVIAVTADALEIQIAEQIAAGADLHLSKPIEASRLMQAISEALELTADLRDVA